MLNSFICVSFLVVSVAASRNNEQHTKPQEQQVESSHSVSNKIHQTHGGRSINDGYEDVGHSNGAELGSIAHNSAVQADRAVQTQQSAGSQAAYGIKSSLASAALGAAQAAQAALLGKHAIVDNLKRQLTEAQQQLQAEFTLYQRSEAAAQFARSTAHQSQTQVTTLTAALAAAQAGAQRAGQAASEAANSNAAQHSMVLEAKQRVDRLLGQLRSASEELQATETSARKALEAAHQAQANAAAAGEAIGAGGKGVHHSSHYF